MGASNQSQILIQFLLLFVELFHLSMERLISPGRSERHPSIVSGVVYFWIAEILPCYTTSRVT